MIRLARKYFSRSKAAAKPAISLHDLLGRPPVNLDTPEMQRFLAGKRVMVTGAGGSIGSEICRQTMRFCPDRMVLLERAENSLFEIDRELRQRWIGADLRAHLADIVDAERITQIFEAERPQVIFHCAAHKHVPMTEINPCEAIRNNVLGTKVVADAAARVEAQAFVMVSTDKAVNPTSVMGATKRVAELYVQACNTGYQPVPSGNTGHQPVLLSSKHQDGLVARCTETRFTAVRFGNVLGSSGSVIPIFQKQIEAGGPVTVTHPDMKRYFMTIPEASQLVMQAGAIGQGGEIFVLDMGEPIRILDLARELIARSGLKLGEEIDIQITGIRPGEKLYEELSCENESIVATPHEKIHVWHLPPAEPQAVAEMIGLLSSVIYARPARAIEALMSIVPEYRPGGVERTAAEPPQAPLRIAPGAAIRAA